MLHEQSEKEKKEKEAAIKELKKESKVSVIEYPRQTVVASIHPSAAAVQLSTSDAMPKENGTTSLNVADRAEHAPTIDPDKVHLSQPEHQTPYAGEGRHIE